MSYKFKENIVICCVVIIVCLIVIAIYNINSCYESYNNYSSPVEDMQHIKLITIPDSVTNINYYEEVIDNNDVSVPHSMNSKSFGVY